MQWSLYHDIMIVVIQIRRVDLDCLGVGGEVERRRLQAAVRELGIHGATQVSSITRTAGIISFWSPSQTLCVGLKLLSKLLGEPFREL